MTPIKRGSVGWEIRRIVAFLCLPIVLMVGFIFKSLYFIFFGWWLTDILADRAQREFTRRIQTYLDFLFGEHGAKVVPNYGDIKQPGRYYSKITLACEDVRLCFTEWRGELHVDVAPAFAPAESHEISTVFMVLAPEKWAGQRVSFVSLTHFGCLLYPRWDALREAFSQENYPEVREKLAEIHDRDIRMTRRLEGQINRGLYSG